jgi:enediyne biosynthesis protein E4
VGDNSWNGYEQNCLFLQQGQDGGGRFVEAARPLGTDGVGDGRGVAVADFDGDGRLDLAIHNNGATPSLYLNRGAGPRLGLRLELVGTVSPRDAVGAKVRLALSGASPETLTRWVEAGSGYAAQGAFPVHFGLGEAPRVETLEVTWPSGTIERWDAAALPPVTAGVWRCVEGTGTVEAPRDAPEADRIAYDE